MSGQIDEGSATLERALSFANDLGLMAEEVHPTTGELLGNFPQAYSHAGLVDGAWAISRALAAVASP